MTLTNNSKQILAIHFQAAPLVQVAIHGGQIRRNGSTPMLRKSIPAAMAARAAVTSSAAHSNAGRA